MNDKTRRQIFSGDSNDDRGNAKLRVCRLIRFSAWKEASLIPICGVDIRSVPSGKSLFRMRDGVYHKICVRFFEITAPMRILLSFSLGPICAVI